MLKEEIEYGRPVTNDQVEEERRKIVDLIKQMEADGKLSFREKGAGAALSGDEIGSETPSLSMSSLLVGAGQKNPDQAMEAYNAGVACSEQGDLEEAIKHYEKAVRADGEHLAAHQGLANAYYSLERYQEASVAYDKVLALEPNDELKAWVEQVRASLSSAA